VKHEVAPKASPKKSPESKKSSKAKAIAPTGFTAIRAQAPALFSSLEGALFAMAGECIASGLIKGKPLSQERALFFFAWGTRRAS